MEDEKESKGGGEENHISLVRVSNFLVNYQGYGTQPL